MSKNKPIRDIFRKPRGMVGLVLKDPKTSNVITDPRILRSVCPGNIDKCGEINLAHNLVVTLARENMSRLIAGDTNPAGERYVSKMSWGGAGHDPGTPTNAVPPTAGDVALGSEISSVGKKTAAYDFPDATTVRFVASLSEAEAVGEGLSEVGLWTTDGTLFARKTFGLITKSSSFVFEFRWRILF